ncbi:MULTISPECIES: hypothetical protein [Metallosphaera]|uniref:hypothetical protein n=1 Tax=Metallosphaera TaxID=41980 RepID=UPI001EDD4263|nr:hypothetical protein [Metallosphaera javensis (ex Hofmann et al. 2022)]
MIVQIIYRKFTPEIRKLVLKLRKIRSVEDIIFSKGERNMLIVDGMVAWKEGDGDPMEGFYDVRIIKSMSEINLDVSA